MTLAQLNDRWKRFAASQTGQWVLRGLRWLFTGGVVAYLVYELTTIGWTEIWTSLPTAPLFYLFFLLIYFSLPFTEIFIYRVTWTYDLWSSVWAFLKKRIYNKDVLGYSGEVYFFAWARSHVDLPDRAIAETIRDNNIISSVASTTLAAVLLLVFLQYGEIRLNDLFETPKTVYLVGGGLVAALLIPILVRFRRHLFSMAWKTAGTILLIQWVRLSAGQLLQIGMWDAALPGVSLDVWFTYAAANLMISRIPFLPNRDLVFMAVGIQMGQEMALATADIASMLMVFAVLGKVLNVVLFAGATAYNRWILDAPRPEAPAAPPDPEASPADA
ncbi:hypothetical protein [Salisaeta longa]|uniref:hypothetical protein n=1 Tax=Salisaeta longa TaxID=503170 RepID=UPI0003B53B1E|nr:hypothetical protein [Salisaeta longa]